MKVKTVSRVNPDTGYAEKVPAGSPEAFDWPTTAQWRAGKRKRTKQQKVVEKIVTDTVKNTAKSPVGSRITDAIATRASAAASAGSRAVALGRGSAAAGVATLGVAGTTVAVGAAFAVGYGIGTGFVKLWDYLKPDQRDYRKAIAFKKARQAWEKEQGRPITQDEVRAMSRGFLDSLSDKRK